MKPPRRQRYTAAPPAQQPGGLLSRRTILGALGLLGIGLTATGRQVLGRNEEEENWRGNLAIPPGGAVIDTQAGQAPASSSASPKPAATKPASAAKSTAPAASQPVSSGAFQGPAVAGATGPKLQVASNIAARGEYLAQLARNEIGNPRAYGWVGNNLIDCVSFLVMVMTKYMGGNATGAFNYDGTDARYAAAIGDMTAGGNSMFTPLSEGVKAVNDYIFKQKALKPGDIVMMHLGLPQDYGTRGQNFDHFMIFDRYQGNQAVFVAAAGPSPPNGADGVSAAPDVPAIQEFRFTTLTNYFGMTPNNLAVKEWDGLKRAPAAEVNQEARDIVRDGFADYIDKRRDQAGDLSV